MKSAHFYICFFLLLSISLKAQKRPSILSGDIFQTEYFIENHGQFDAYTDRNQPVKFGVENGGDHIYFNPNGFVYHVKKVIQKSKKRESEDEEDNLKVVEGDIKMRWLNANTNTQIECMSKSHHYFSYGDAPCKSYGYKKIIYRNLYPGIDVVYTIPAKGGVEYSLVVKPGADLSKVQFEYTGSKAKTLLNNNELAIKNSLLDLGEQYLKATYSNGDSAVCNYILNKGIIGFKASAQLNDTLIIDPWAANITTLTSIGIGNNIGYDVDYDKEGNLYVYGGGYQNYPSNFGNEEIAKYNTSGNLEWTFMGSVPSVAWNSAGGGGFAGNFVVDKNHDKIYCAQGFNYSGASIVRLDTAGLYDNYVSYSDVNYNEIWNMNVDCQTGNIFGVGGGTASNQNIGIIDSSLMVTKYNFTGVGGAGQDVLNTVFDKKGSLYAIIASAGTTAVDNKIYKLSNSYSSAIWSAPSGYYSFVELKNIPAITNGSYGYSTNGFNALAANSSYLFYYDGVNIEALNFANGTVVGSPHSINNYTLKYQGGIYADECNNIYVGGNNGNIKVFTFNGNIFTPQPDIVIPGEAGLSVYDIKYYAGTNQLYVCGANFVATVSPSINCVDATVKIKIFVGCNNDIVSIQNPDTTATYTYIWTDSSTNTIVREITGNGHYSDTLPGPIDNTVFLAAVIKNIDCEGASSRIGFIPSFTVDTIKQNICKGQSYTFHGHTYSIAGVYKDTLIGHFGCDSILLLALKVNNPSSKTLNVNLCPGQSYTFNSKVYSKAGTFIDTLTNKAGCDSIVTLNLAIQKVYAQTIKATTCPGVPYVIGTHKYTATGTYTDTLTNKAGCDSIVILNLTVQAALTTTVYDSICAGNIYYIGKKAYTATGIYTDTIKSVAGCDSIVTLHLTVKSTSASTINDTICQGLSYSFNGNTYTKAGTYKATFANKAGCDSVVTLNLAIRTTNTQKTIVSTLCYGQSYTFYGKVYTTSGTYTNTVTSKAGACDSVITLKLTVRKKAADTINQFICTGQSYTIAGKTYTVSGTYINSTTTTAGCDSTITLNLTVEDTSSHTINQTICQGQTYTLGKKTYSTSGTYTQKLTNKGGCDSVVTVNLTVADTSAATIKDSICQGHSYSYNGKTYSAAGTYKVILTNAGGCDSTVTLKLVVKDTSAKIIDTAICYGQSYMFNGQTYITSGTYTEKLTNKAGCDSTITLNLTIRKKAADTINKTICAGQSYTVAGKKYTTAGTYINTVLNTLGCDSTITLNLMVTDTSATLLKDTICAGQTFSFNNNTYNTTGTYKAILTNKGGCDSIVTLNLVVKDTSATRIDATICNGQSYSFNSNTYSTTGTYKATLTNRAGCDSIVTLHLTVNYPSTYTINAAICIGQSYTLNTVKYTTAGTYIDSTLTNKAGCDSFITLNLTVNPLPTIVATSGNPYICYGDTCTLRATGAATYIWQPGGYTGADMLLQPDSTITYIVTGTDNNGCSNTDSITIDVHAKLYHGILTDTSVNEGGNITLWSSNNKSHTYEWSPGTNISSTTVSNPVSKPVSYITYYVWYIDRQGCKETDTINIVIHPCNAFVPNAFTPNGDGINDVVVPIPIHGAIIDAFNIYDRWGEQVYTYSSVQPWAGKNQGNEQPLNIGTYVYVLKFHCEDGHTHMKQGNITLLR